MCLPEPLGDVRPVRQEELRDRLFFQHDGQLEGCTVAGRAEILHQRADGTGKADDEGLRWLKGKSVLAFQSSMIPTGIWVPVLEDGRDTGGRDFPSACRIAELRQGAEGMKPLAHVVRIEHGQAATDLGSVQR